MVTEKECKSTACTTIFPKLPHVKLKDNICKFESFIGFKVPDSCYITLLIITFTASSETV
jgi:hypothetical protein